MGKIIYKFEYINCVIYEPFPEFLQEIHVKVTNLKFPLIGLSLGQETKS